MPSRRRPAEPSPRLLALLGDGDAARTAEARQAGRQHRDGQRAERHRGEAPQERTKPETQPGTHEPWLPQRDWLTGGSSGAAAPAPGPPAPTPAAAPGRHRRPRPPGPALLTVPTALRGARLTGPRTAALGMVLVVVLAVAVFGVRVALARAASAPHPVERADRGTSATAVVARTGAPTGFGTGAASSPTGAAGAPTTRPGEVVVHVVGQVRKPGVVVLELGDRVSDAVAKAGGARPGADLGALNLARALVDGEQVRVPRPGEAAVAPPGGAGGSAPGGSAVGGGGAGGLVNLNTASASALEELPGVGPVLAQRIVDWRTEHGRFTSVDELAEVSGIGEKMFAQMQGKVTV